jgi:chromosome partitioning protein
VDNFHVNIFIHIYISIYLGIDLSLMKRLLLLGMKGGTGKSTVAIHLAVAAAQAGRHVTLVDTDPQATTMTWASARAAADPYVMAVRAYEAIRRMRDMNGRDLAVIDTPPRAEADITGLAREADLIVIPLHCTMPDLTASQLAFRMAESAKRPFVVVFNAVNPRGLEVAEVRQELSAQGYTVAPSMLAHRTSFARALSNGLAVTEFEQRGQAAEEIRNLWKWISKQL